MAKFNTGQSFADGDQVTGAKLNNIVGLLDIYSGIIADQTAIAATVSTADLLLIADTDAGSSGAANKVTIQKLLNDTLTGGTFTNANIAEQLTYGTATGNRTISTSAVITNGTISNATLGTTTGTLATITNLTAGTTTSTAANITNGTVQTLTASTANISQGSAILTQGTIATLNSTTGTIGNFTTTLVGDLTISTGSATVGTRVAVVNTAQEYTAAHNFNATTLTSGNSIDWNLQSNQVARLVLSTNGTMADATNKVDGATYILLVTQGTGSNTLDWNATYKWPGGTKPTLTVGSAKSDIFTFISDGTSLFGVASQNYS
jgi:hypothetical protein